jgi:hypothetical protein
MLHNKRKYEDTDLPPKKKGSHLSKTPTRFFAETNNGHETDSHPFRIALEQLLSLMRQNEIHPYHLSHLLREIARHHRQTVMSRTVTTFELDIYNLIKLLNEEAVAIEPRNILAKNEYKFFIEKVTIFATHKSDNKLGSEDHLLSRKDAFARFWNMIDIYIKRLSLLYPVAHRDHFIGVLTHLAHTKHSEIQIMLRKHTPAEKQKDIMTVFQNAIQTFHDQQKDAKKLTGQKP